MYKYVLKRLVLLVPVIFGITLIVFSILQLTPGDPGRLILGNLAPQESVNQLNNELGYNKPLIVKYVNYMTHAVRGDFGVSYRTGIPVANEIIHRFPTTLLLALLTIITAVAIGVPLGIFSAVKQYSAIDSISVVLAMLMSAIPGFWLGLMMIILFSIKLGWLPTSGIDSLKSFIMPTLILAIPASAEFLRLTRATMLETISEDYIRTARAKGATERTIIWKHALKNALLPVVTVIGIGFGNLLGGTIIAEAVFSLPGLGSYLLLAIRMKDIPQVMATVIFLATLFCIIMVFVDIAYAFIDPRVKARYTN